MPQSVTTKYSLDLNEFFQQAELISNRFGQLEGVVTNMRRIDPFKQANTSAQQISQTLGQQIQIYQRVNATAEAFRAEQVRLKQVYTELKAKQNEFIAAGRYDELKGNLSQIQTRLKELRIGLGEAAEKAEKLNKAGSGTSSGGGILGKLLGGGGKGDIKGTVAELTGMIGVSFGVAEALKLTITESARFGKGLSTLSALTGVVGKDLEFLGDAAIDLENKTGIAATDIVEGFKLVGGIKPELLENKEALAQVTDEVVALSQASGETLADSATVAVGALNQFGEGADQAGRFVNVLAAGSKLGASELRDTGEALKTAGTSMKAANLSFEQGNALIQSLAGVMIKGSEAGTGLRNILLKLETASDKNMRPSVVGLDKALENASKKLDTTTELTKFFGVENVVAARRILDTRTEITKLTADLTGTNTAYEQQRINLDNLSTDLSKAGTATVGFFRDLGQSQDGFLRFAVRAYTSFLQTLTSKTGEFRAFFRGVFSDGLILNPVQATYNGIDAVVRQRQANLIAERKRTQDAEVKKVASETIQRANDKETRTLAANNVPLIDANVIATERTLKDRNQKLLEARDQYNKTATLLQKASADQKIRIAADGKLDALALKQAKENQQTAAQALKQATKNRADQIEAARKAASEGPSDATKKAQKKALDIENETARLLLAAQKEYAEEATKLETEFGKERLEALKKDGTEYINAKFNLEQDALKVQRDAIEKQLQLAKSNKVSVVNGKRQVIADTSVTLENSAPRVAEIFAQQQQQLEVERARQLQLSRVRQEYQLLELAKQSADNELAIFDKYWEEKLLSEKDHSATLASLELQRDAARKVVAASGNKAELIAFDEAWAEIIANEKQNGALYLALVAKRNRDRNTLITNQILETSKKQEDISLAFIDTDRFADIKQTEDPTLNAEKLETVRQQARYRVQIEAGEQRIKLLKEQGEQENAVLITQTQAAVDKLKQQQKSLTDNSPKYTDIYDLLGITDGLDASQLDKFRQSMQVIGNSIREATAAIVEQSEARIQALNSEIQAKEEQVKIEEERDKEGFANNAELRRSELEALKKQKAEEQQTRKQALVAQQALDIASITSTNAVTAANLIGSAAASFRSAAESSFNPILGVIQAVAAIAVIFSTIIAVRAKAKAAAGIQLRGGGRIPKTGRTHEQGGHKIEGTDYEVEKGEHFINAQDSERYDKTLQALNKNNPQEALRQLLAEGGVGLPQVIIQQMSQANFGQAGKLSVNLSPLQAELMAMREEMKVIRQNTKPQPQFVTTHEGEILEITPDGKRILHKKR
jgi:hypothetical protein